MNKRRRYKAKARRAAALRTRLTFWRMVERTGWPRDLSRARVERATRVVNVYAAVRRMERMFPGAGITRRYTP